MGLEGVLKGTQAIQEAIAKGPTGTSRFLKLEDGDTVEIRFLQELDDSASGFDESRGLVVGFYEHMNPDDFKQSFRCTAETEGRCAGCERVPVNSRWRAKGRLLANVAVLNNSGDDEVKIFSTSLSPKGLAPQLVEYSDEYGTLCDRPYKLSRKGKTYTDTSYTLIPRGISPLSKGLKEIELIDLSEVIRDLSYAEQNEMLNGSGSGKDDW